MLTKKDMLQIEEMFDQKFDEKFDERLIEFREMIAGFKDEILTVLRPLQEDHNVLSHRVAEHSDQIEQLDYEVELLKHSH
jgi:hypothetical protein